MRSLFLKVFLWFWLAMIVVIATFAVTTHLTHTPEAFRPPQFIEAVLTGYAPQGWAQLSGSDNGRRRFLTHRRPVTPFRIQIKFRRLSGAPLMFAVSLLAFGPAHWFWLTFRTHPINFL